MGVDTALFFEGDQEVIFKIFPPLEEFTSEILEFYKLICDRGGLVIPYETECSDDTITIVYDDDLLKRTLCRKEINPVNFPTCYNKNFIYDTIKRNDIAKLEEYKFKLDDNICNATTPNIPNNEDNGQIIPTKSPTSKDKSQVLTKTLSVTVKKLNMATYAAAPKPKQVPTKKQQPENSGSKDNSISVIIEDDSDDDDDDDFEPAPKRKFTSHVAGPDPLKELRIAGYREKFKLAEDLKILESIRENDWYNFQGGNLIWKKMKESSFKDTGRTWLSLQTHFRRKMRDNLEKYKLSDTELKKYSEAKELMSLGERRKIPEYKLDKKRKKN